MYMHVNVHVQQTLKLDEDLTCGTKVEIFNSHLCDDTDEYINILWNGKLVLFDINNFHEGSDPSISNFKR